MSHTEKIIGQALGKIQGLIGEILFASIKRQGITKRHIVKWQRRLREAADILDKLL